MTDQKDRVIEIMQENIAIREERNSSYGEEFYGGCYKQHGPVKNALFPSGIEIYDENDMSRMACLDQIIGKLIRYCNSFVEGGHEDSLRDIQVYAAMLQELDEMEISEDE